MKSIKLIKPRICNEEAYDCCLFPYASIYNNWKKILSGISVTVHFSMRLFTVTYKVLTSTMPIFIWYVCLHKCILTKFYKETFYQNRRWCALLSINNKSLKNLRIIWSMKSVCVLLNIFYFLRHIFNGVYFLLWALRFFSLSSTI